MTDAELTRIYNKANGIAGGKNPPITTQRIFTAMRAAIVAEREACAKIADNMHIGIVGMADAIRGRGAK